MDGSSDLSSRRGAYIGLQILTVARVPISIVFAAVLLGLYQPANDTPQVALLIACTVILLLGEVTDALDGFLARRYSLQSEWGAMLDPYADSVSRLIIYWALGQAGLALALVVLVMAVRDVTVAYCRIIWTRQGRSVGAKLSGKVKAVVQFAGAFILLLLPLFVAVEARWPMLAVSWLVIVATAWSGLDYVSKLRISGDSART